MTILEEVQVTLEFSDMDRRVALPRLAAPDGFVAQAPRSAGVHMSGILKPLAIAAKQLKSYEQDEEEYPLMWALGVAWEEFVASLYPTMHYQPGEVTVDEIHMTCDGLNYLPAFDVECVEECKSTYESSAKPISWMKMMQGKAYCYGYGPRVVRWHSCHLRGDYKNWKPSYWRRTIQFTDKEVESCWKMMVANKALGVAEQGQGQ